MAVSLVSTGVQFPDSSIQTTAASPSGLVLVSSTTPTVATTLSGTFSSTYDNYLINVYNIMPSSSNAELQIQFAVGGTLQTSGYWDGFGLAAVDYSQAQFPGSRSNIRLTSNCESNSAERGAALTIWFRNVNSTSSTKSFNGMATWWGNGNSGQSFYGAALGGVGISGSSAALSGFSLYWNSGQTFQARGVMKIYGYKN
jgi:hypothetical protein